MDNIPKIEKMTCPRCSKRLDVTDLEPLEEFICPLCKKVLRKNSLFERYELIKICGIGGMAKVYEAVDTLDGKTVLVEKDLIDDERQEGRRNFTIMHEGAHHILKIVYPNDYGVAAPTIHYHKENKNQNKRITDWEEWQADTLASMLLMPKEVVSRGMALVGLPNKIPALSRICSGDTYIKFCYLANFLGVSKKALAIRLKQMGVVAKEYIGNPYGLIDIDMEV